MGVKKKKLSENDMVLEIQNMDYEWRHVVEHLPPYSYQEMEQAFWHLWNLNVYHIAMSFDVNMTLLLDWALVFHMDQKK